MSTGEWINHNLLKSAETPTSGDHVSTKIPHSSQVLPSHHTHKKSNSYHDAWPSPSCDKWPSSSLNRQPPLLMKGFLPCVPLMKGLSPTSANGPPSRWMTSSADLLPQRIIFSLNDWCPPSMIGIQQQMISELDELSPSLMQYCLLCWWTAFSWSPPVC